ncbi:AraC family transcriptional regulator [Alicyclobacillus fastidiosus]|uniref:AraC family transcriptional regulator n=1 Tax=Alicyclobacillus fastidiosus TaxID=392011 RepID=A0ABV5A987_9BACL|nr:AraC family transcriptional regulator [Alicyclobacillus fastidiosus]WEH10716.1 AraC family transcriptional regulator [Alicyclobacillus fastidiosus]
MGLRDVALAKSEILLYESKHLPGEVVTPHHHTIYQILYILSGDGTITLQGTPYEVTNDQMVLIAPYTEHAVYARSRMTVLVLAFGDFLEDLTGTKELFSSAFRTSKYHMLDSLSANELRDSFRKILYEQSLQGSFSDLAIRGHLLHVLLTLTRSWEDEHFRDSNAHRANVLRHYIEAHYYHSLSAEDLANRLKITSRHMNAIFKEQFHMTPIQYLNDVRIKQAKELLLGTDKEIISICFEVGFETISTFYRAFKRKVGMSPQQFRKAPS